MCLSRENCSWRLVKLRRFIIEVHNFKKGLQEVVVGSNFQWQWMIGTFFHLTAAHCLLQDKVDNLITLWSTWTLGVTHIKINTKYKKINLRGIVTNKLALSISITRNMWDLHFTNIFYLNFPSFYVCPTYFLETR